MIKHSTSQNPRGEIDQMQLRTYEVGPHVQDPNPSREPGPSLETHDGDRVKRRISGALAYRGNESVTQASLSQQNC